MITNERALKRASLFGIALLGLACSESYRSTIVDNPIPAVEAALLVSDSAPAVGAVLTVTVQAVASQGVVGSYTGRINYDSTALRYDSDVAMSDQALRASNPLPGQLRFAGAAATGFAEGRLASYKFAVLRTDAVRTLSLVVSEMHMITRADAKTVLTVAPVRVIPR